MGTTLEEIREIVTGYATVAAPALQASARARLLGLLDRLDLQPAPLRDERIDAARFQADAALRGAIRAHLDLAFRSSLDPGELMVVATQGIARVVWHPELEELPVGVALALSAGEVVRSREQLFESGAAPGGPMLTVFALATNPPRLGAGSQLLAALRGDCRRHTPASRLLAFSPLTGLRAAVITLVDDEERWQQLLVAQPELDGPRLRAQIHGALARDRAPRVMPEPLRSWLAAEARAFAASPGYAVGRFHLSQGATLLDVCDHADSRDSDALWARALFDYA